ncbi:hypothetical protein ES703_27250 [subsurface metagenome]
MTKRLHNRGSKFKKILAGTVLAASLFPAQAVYASDSPKKEKAPVSIILGGRKGFGKSGLYGGEFGVRFGRIGLVANLGSGPDLNLQKTEEKVSGFEGVYFKGSEDLKNSSYFGGALEYHQPGKGVSWVIGAGGGLEKVTREIEENLVRDGTSLASNRTSTQEEKFAGYFYTGPSFKIKKLEINPNIGYKTGREKGVFVNLRIILPISKRGDR